MFETYLGYDMLCYKSSANIPAFIANAAGGQFVINYGSWLGGVADIYAAHNGNVSGGVTVNEVSYRGGKLDNASTVHQFGRRVSLRSRLTPFLEMLMCADTVKGSVPLRLPPGQTAIVVLFGGSLIVNGGSAGAKNIRVRASSAQIASAYKLGGGLDLELNKPVSLRPIAVDLQYTRLQQLRYPQLNKSQYNCVYTTGLNSRCGGASITSSSAIGTQISVAVRENLDTPPYR